jgi:hypothetical protein
VTKNPFINAFVAVLYIVLVASVMYYGPKLAGKQETIIVPIAMISLFTLSAAVMGYLFFYEPFQFFMSGEKRKAVNLFLQTVAVFACITVVAFTALFLKLL